MPIENKDPEQSFDPQDAYVPTTELPDSEEGLLLKKVMRKVDNYLKKTLNAEYLKHPSIPKRKLKLDVLFDVVE